LRVLGGDVDLAARPDAVAPRAAPGGELSRISSESPWLQKEQG
jgi:hypothetical protein